MRVICIKKGPWHYACDGRKAGGPAYHEECLVITEFLGHVNPRPCYILKGWAGSYEARRFRPLPDISPLQSLLTTSNPNKVRETEDA